MARKSGLVAIVGQPNVGKSTLINAFVGQKVSIVSPKPQTTRRRVIGVAQTDAYQIAFVDTPGIHEPHTRLGRGMVEQARGSLADLDAILVVVDVSRLPNEIDKQIAKLVRSAAGLPDFRPTIAEEAEPPAPKIPIVLCLNKMDMLKPEFVIENSEAFAKLFGTQKWMLTSAHTKRNLDKLIELIVADLPEGEGLFPDDEFTDQSTRFIVAELIREKVLLASRQEIPHSTAVQVESWEEDENGKLQIGVAVIVEKASQRAIVIGKGGQFIKKIGTEARAEIEALLERQIYLDLHVIVREDWRQNPKMLRELEYTE